MSQTNEIEAIISGDIQALQSFITANNQTFSFPDLNQNDQQQKLWSVLFQNLESNTTTSVVNLCLSALRILSRDKTNLNDLITEDRFNVLLRLAGLEVNDYENDDSVNKNPNFDIITEALKCICNIVFNSTAAQKLCSKNNAVDGIINRLRISGDPDIPHDVRYFDMKLLFLITALNTETRPYLKNELHGLTYLTETIDLVLKEAAESTEQNSQGQEVMEGQVLLSDQQVMFLCEVLKVLFNITIRSNEISVDEEEEVHYKRLVTVLHDLLLTPIRSADKKQELHSHIINLLTCVPFSSYEELCPKIIKGQEIPKDMEYDGRNMEAIYQLLQYLKTKVEMKPGAVGQQEALSPILSALTRSARSVRYIRKYARMYVLPPLKEVHKRPEEGDSLRNYLCRLLTTPCTQVRDLAADFLFVLCKESVARMIKYTGYGNAAGLFATRGLMDGRSVGEKPYSSESEDSDTEIYKEYRHGINPVVGCYEKPRPSPTANMTEEQKEYEAMQLVNLMDKMTRSGIMAPCRIGEDGRPEPVEHVLQLQEELPRQQVRRNIDDDDDDDDD